MNYLISDFVIRLKNAARARRRKVVMPFSKTNKSIGKILVKENFLKDIKDEVQDGKKTLVAEIRYEKRNPVLSDVLIVSKPSLRVYARANNVSKLKKREGTIIISTSQGIMTDTDAKKKGVGGEILFRIW